MVYVCIFICVKIVFLISCIVVINVPKTLHAVFMLIISFTLGACICIFLEAYFVSFLFVIVYVGAVAVLFLFVLMLLEFHEVESDESSENLWESGHFVYTLLAVVYVVSSQYFRRRSGLFQNVCDARCNPQSSVFSNNFTLTEFFVYQPNTFLIGQVMYTQYFIAVILVGLVLFVAMIGAICLAFKSVSHTGSKAYAQDLSAQVFVDSNFELTLRTPSFKKLSVKILNIKENGPEANGFYILFPAEFR